MKLLNCVLCVLCISALKPVSGLRLAKPYAEFLSKKNTFWPFDNWNPFTSQPFNSEVQSGDIRPIGFVKTHKTASSTVLKIVQNLAKRHDKKIGFPKDDHFWGWPGSFPGKGNVRKESPQYDLIANHAVFNSAKWKEYLASNPTFVSVLREPSDQAVAAYDYYNWAHQRYSLSKHLSWIASLQRSIHSRNDKWSHKAEFLNPQAWDLGWYEYVGYTQEYDHNMTKINEWLAELDKDFSDVMILENLDQGLTLLARTLHIDPRELAYVPMNVHHGRKTKPTQSESTKLSKLYPVDRALYKHFKDKFQSRWAKEGSSSDLALLTNEIGTIKAQCEDKTKCPVSWKLGEIAFTHYLHQRSYNMSPKAEKELIEESEQVGARAEEESKKSIMAYLEELFKFNSTDESTE